MKYKTNQKQGPGLAVILVGERKDSQTYVNMKTKACEEIGIEAIQINLPATVQTQELLDTIRKLNADTKINGILVQLPLPSHVDTEKVIANIAPEKDVDGLTLTNAGELFQKGDGAPLIPCTPLGCLYLLDAYKIPIEGKFAVVIGRSALVGKPMMQLLFSRNATVVCCHSRTKDLPSIVGQADIVVAAIGKPEFVKGEWLKPGAVVIDVGINPVDDATKKSGYRLVGDVDFTASKSKCSAITPVPG
jgi:5,10-methylene-tetrahydrofolate dehydrogenase/methenyl tetrahydrofolate cyclohydrolase